MMACLKGGYSSDQFRNWLSRRWWWCFYQISVVPEMSGEFSTREAGCFISVDRYGQTDPKIGVRVNVLGLERQHHPGAHRVRGLDFKTHLW